jgi:hypothetical protein
MIYVLHFTLYFVFLWNQLYLFSHSHNSADCFVFTDFFLMNTTKDFYNLKFLIKI